jgi:hypothetical protein
VRAKREDWEEGKDFGMKINKFMSGKLYAL